MDRKQIELDTWNRKEIYDAFSAIGFPFYAVTIPIDVTHLKKISKSKNVSFYHLMIWVVTKAVNAVPAFNMRINDNQVCQLQQTHPSFTTMDKGGEVFKIITMDWEEDYLQFCRHAKEQCEKQKTLFSDSDERDDLIYISCTPWFDFTSLSSERSLDTNDAIPRLCWGKYEEQGDKLMLHLSVDVNHRTIDGFHIGKLKEWIDREIAALS